MEYGVGNQKRIILLHGGGLSWWNHRKAAERLSGDFHVILPVLDGHAGSDRDFAGIGENAEELLRYIDEYCGGSVLLIGGVSLGAQILLETIARRKNVCRYAVIESASVIPSKMLAPLMARVVKVDFGLVVCLLWLDPAEMVCPSPVPISSDASGTFRGLLSGYLQDHRRKHGCFFEGESFLRRQ